jgi:DNA-binding transcriptional LysR family regulator
MQLQQLRYVLALAEEGQFVRAAAHLHVAQPSISTAVRALERELGVRLFDRARSGLVLTAAGEAFLPWARQALADCDAGVAAVRELSGLRRGRVVLGATPSLTTTLLPSVLSGFGRDHPGVELVVEEAGSGVLVERLEEGRMDLALVILPVERSWVRTVPLAEEELVLAVPTGHALASRPAVGLADLARVPLVMFRDGYDLRETTLSACARAGVRPRFAVEGLEMDGVLAMAAAGLGGAVLPESAVAAGSDLVGVPFRPRALVREFGLAYRRDRTLSAAASRVSSLLTEAAAARRPTLTAPVPRSGR